MRSKTKSANLSAEARKVKAEAFGDGGKEKTKKFIKKYLKKYLVLIHVLLVIPFFIKMFLLSETVNTFLYERLHGWIFSAPPASFEILGKMLVGIIAQLLVVVGWACVVLGPVAFLAILICDLILGAYVGSAWSLKQAWKKLKEVFARKRKNYKFR